MTEYLEFVDAGTSASGKTRVWIVARIGGDDLGLVQWFGRWRQYCFFPAPATVWSDGCMRQVQEFVAAATKAHRS